MSMEDKRAHERLDGLEQVIKNHIEAHAVFEKAITENTILTREIADNTSEMVALFKGVKGLRTFVVWGTPIVVAYLAVLAYLRGWK